MAVHCKSMVVELADNIIKFAMKMISYVDREIAPGCYPVCMSL